MKKIIMLLAGIAIIQVSNAQVTLPASLLFAAGDVYSLQPATSDGSLPSAPGANVNVDCSSIAAQGVSITQRFTGTATTPYQSSFPGASLASPDPEEQSSNGYTYYNISSGRIELAGVASPDLVMVYSNPMLMFSYPANYGDSTSDDFAATYSVSGVDAVRGGHVTTVADAYGNITTPKGTFAYLRFKTTQLIVDTFYRGGNMVGVSVQNAVSYSYMNNSIKVPVMAYSEISTSQGDITSAYYYNGTRTGVREEAAALAGASLFPNPAQGRLTVSVPANAMASAQLRVYDMQGRRMQVPVSGAGESRNEMSLDISSLAPGVYSLQLGSGSSNRTMKFVVK